MQPMKSFVLSLPAEGIEVINSHPSLRLYQKKFDGPNTVRFVTNRSDSLVKDLSKAFGGSHDEISKLLGLMTAAEKAELSRKRVEATEQRVRKLLKKNVKKELEILIRQAKANGVDVRDLV